MSTLVDDICSLAQECASLPDAACAEFARNGLAALLVRNTPNFTGDDPPPDRTATFEEVITLPPGTPAVFREELDACRKKTELLNAAIALLSEDARGALAAAIRRLAMGGFLNDYLVDKFRIPANREFLDKGLHNAACHWQMAMVANWALNDEGIASLAGGTWETHCPGMDLPMLIRELVARITFRHIPDLRSYRRDALRHYPKLTAAEFSHLASARWQEVIDLPSGRATDKDIPCITPFIKQGDIEHSLYRHYVMPDLLQFMRNATPPESKAFDLQGRDRNILFSLPIVAQQVGEELFNAVKGKIAGQIRSWAAGLAGAPDNETAVALAILHKIWNYRRTPAAQDCNDPVDNLVKGFTATIRNALTYFTDINIAAAQGSTLGPLDVSERFVLFASVSNGQLDNLEAAHNRYIGHLHDPAAWDNETFFQHFLAVNRDISVNHIQPHFVVDKTRGCPAIPQIARFHEIVLDLVLEFALGEFGETNLRQAGDWYLREKAGQNMQ